MVYPPGGFPAPVGSFTEPVKPPGVSPTSGDLVYVGVNCAWLPYIAGALTQLLLESTWEVASTEEFIIVQGEAISLIQLFNCGRLPTLQELCKMTDGSGCEDCMGCCIRFNDGKLQTLECGVWTDVPGQGTDMPIQPAQPGAGSPQPKPNGGEQEYCGAMANGGTWLIPTPVSSGDTLLFSNLTGAWHDAGGLFWYCPDGYLFVNGVCVVQIPVGGMIPLPSALFMQIIVQIDGTFYDPLQLDIDGNPTVFVVPSGHTNAQAVLQANITNLANVSGTVSFCVMVTNNQQGNWQSTFDFTASPYSEIWSIGDGAWSLSQGYVGTPAAGQNSTVVLNATPASTVLTSAQMFYDCDGGAGGSFKVQLAANGTLIIPATTPTVGTNEQIGEFNTVTGVTSIQPAIGDGTGGTRVAIRKLVFTGLGSRPAGWPTS